MPPILPSTSLALKAGPNKYDHISFIIGVDSARNFSGAQTGALDPANGMFWTWNSGYIMAKLEGSSPISTQPDNRIEYHIGGFKDPDNVLQKVVLPFPETASIDFSPNSTATVTITANVNAWFNNPNELHIAQTPVCMTPGDLSKKIAENYSKMFTITHIATK
ncbi:MAG: MbnP family protein [Chitinophagaceae bacterium]